MVLFDVSSLLFGVMVNISDCMFRTLLYFENYGSSIFRNIGTYITHIVVS